MPAPRRMLRRLLQMSCLAGVAGFATGCASLAGNIDTGGNAERIAASDTESPVLREAAELIDAGKGDEAFERLVAWLQANNRPRPASYDDALFLAANGLIEAGERVRGFYYLEQLLDEYPGSPLYRPAVELQYEIATSYLRGENDIALFLPMNRYDEAIEMLFRVQLRVPGSELAEQALLTTADFYYDRGDYDFAEDAYGVFIERFPRSGMTPTVRLKQAYANLRQYEGPKYDPTPLLDARAQLQQFATEYPGLAVTQQIPGLIRWINDQLAEKLVIEADYYGRVDEPEAKRLLLRRAAEQYPDTEHGQAAAARIPAPATTQSSAGGGEG